MHEHAQCRSTPSAPKVDSVPTIPFGATYIHDREVCDSKKNAVLSGAKKPKTKNNPRERGGRERGGSRKRREKGKK